MAEMNLTREEVLKLINVYRLKECLWNYKSPMYKRLDIKNKAWAEISREFKVSVNDVKRKIKHLRTAFVAEKKKVEASKKSGSSADIYSPCLFYYEDFKFLEEAIILRTRTTNDFKFLKCEDPGPLEETVTDDFDQSNGPIGSFDFAYEAFEHDDVAHDDMELSTDGELERSSATQPKGPSPKLSTTLMGAPNSAKATESKRIQKSTLKPASSTSNATQVQRTQKTSLKAAASKITAKYQNAIEQIVGKVSEPLEEEDAYDAFGKSIALRLRQLPELNSAEAMLDLESVMLKHTRRALLSKSVKIIANDIIRPASLPSTSTSGSSCFSYIRNRSSTPEGYSARSSTSTLSSDILQTAMSDADIISEEECL